MPPHKAELSPTLRQLAAVAGEDCAVTDPAEIEPHLVEWRGRYVGRSPLLLKPRDTEQVSAILRFAHENRVPIVTQGGNTGLVGGQTPSPAGDEVVLSLGRMNRVRHVDAAGNTMTVEAGVTLQAARDAAAGAGRLFPLSLAAQGSCTIGGNLATNAGGVHVLRYGNARDLALGLEAVFADGQVWRGLKALRKDNTGYDLKNLLIGSEGTLAVITAATLKLFPRPAETVTVLAALPGLPEAGALFSQVFERSGGFLSAFELLPRIGIDFVTRHVDGARDPFANPHPWYALFELDSPAADGSAAAHAEALLAEAFERGFVADAVVARSQAQTAELWRLREAMSEVQKHEGGSIKHDVSVPVAAIPDFIAQASAAVERIVPGARPVPFGHYGDGNIHFNLSQPVGIEPQAFLSRWDEVSDAVHAIVLGFGGSISAEHGIGQMKAGLMARIKSPVELEMMRRIKAALDPHGILNPGKVLPPPSDHEPLE